MPTFRDAFLQDAALVGVNEISREIADAFDLLLQRLGQLDCCRFNGARPSGHQDNRHHEPSRQDHGWTIPRKHEGPWTPTILCVPPAEHRTVAAARTGWRNTPAPEGFR